MRGLVYFVNKEEDNIPLPFFSPRHIEWGNFAYPLNIVGVTPNVTVIVAVNGIGNSSIMPGRDYVSLRTNA